MRKKINKHNFIKRKKSKKGGAAINANYKESFSKLISMGFDKEKVEKALLKTKKF